MVRGAFNGAIQGLGFRVSIRIPEGSRVHERSQIVYVLVLQRSPCRYLGAQVYAIVHMDPYPKP